jgi:hypothetical protein
MAPTMSAADTANCCIIPRVYRPVERCRAIITIRVSRGAGIAPP